MRGASRRLHNYNPAIVVASHANAKLTPRGRLTLVTRILGGQSARAVAAAFGVSASTARKWVRRYQAGGADALIDRSSRPRVMPSKVPCEVEDRVEALRRSGLTYALIAANLAMPISTVALICKRRSAAGRQRQQAF